MYRYDIDQQLNLISVVASGDVDLGASRDLLSELVNDPRFDANADFLVDVREMTAVPSPDDLRRFSDVIVRLGLLCGRFAVVAAAGVQFGMGRMLATFASLRGVEMHVFREHADAVSWLDEGRRATTH